VHWVVQHTENVPPPRSPKSTLLTNTSVVSAIVPAFSNISPSTVNEHPFFATSKQVDWMVNHAGADYLKIDSCCGNQDHKVAFSDYAKFRDAMNATGKPVWFSLW
jgi:prephenate dehydrogenase